MQMRIPAVRLVTHLSIWLMHSIEEESRVHDLSFKSHSHFWWGGEAGW